MRGAYIKIFIFLFVVFFYFSLQNIIFITALNSYNKTN